MAKKVYSVSLDPEVWELATQRIDGSLSGFIQKQLEVACRVTDEITVLEKEIHEKENELIALRTKLCSLKDDGIKKESSNDLEVAMKTMHNIMTSHGYVGKNQIRNIADLHNLSAITLLGECKAQGIVIREFFEPNKERLRNPVTGKY